MRSITYLENNGVDIKKSLDLFGDIGTYNANVGEFLVGIHTKITQLITFMQNKDMSNYEIYAHSMMSDADFFGFTKLARLAEEHEIKSKAGDMFYVTEHINDLINETNNTINIIQEYMNGTDEVSNLQTPSSNQVSAPAPNASSGLQVDSVNPENVFTSKTILVVDDSNIIRNFVKRIFSDTYNVGQAINGDEAIKIIKANKDNDFIVAILLDLNMPVVDGFAVLDFMNYNGLLSKMPVSIISGDSSKETIDKAFTYQIVDMLSKPFNEQNIRMVIEKTLIFRGES